MQGIGKYPASGSSPAHGKEESDSRPFFSATGSAAHIGILLVSSLLATLLTVGRLETLPGVRSELLAFARAELALHPSAEIGDLYKLLYQGNFGVGHIIRSREAALSYLEEELRGLEPASAEPLLRPCNQDASMLRVNLRPFLRDSLSTNLLVDAMLLTVRVLRPDSAVFLRSWREIGALIERGSLPFGSDRFRVFTDSLRREGYPAVHHSAAYTAAYRPAYRVVLRSAYERCFSRAALP
jgi:hypothetical protein